MYWDLEMTEEEEEEMIRSIANKIHRYGMEVAAILMLESVKPLSFIGAQMGRFFISPFLPAFGDNIGLTGEKIFHVFEKHENMEKLLTVLEELAQEESQPPKKEAWGKSHPQQNQGRLQRKRAGGASSPSEGKF